MAKDTSTGTGDQDFPSTTWGTGEGVGALSNPTGREHILDPRTRTAPPAGVKPTIRKPKARSSVTPW